jgi:hypothetical protein
MEDVTIVIQGKINPDVLLGWVHHYPDWKVIISTWITEDLQNIEFPKHWMVLRMPKIEDNLGYGNLYLQVKSTLNGLVYVDTPYCVKIRGDEFYSNLPLMIDEMKLNQSRIYCSTIFFRALFPNCSFHISDHILVGTTDNMKIMFENSNQLMKNYFRFPEGGAERDTPEPYLGFGFIQKKEGIPLEEVESILNTSKVNQSMTLKWFGVFPLELLEPYTVSVRGDQHHLRCNCKDNLR